MKVQLIVVRGKPEGKVIPLVGPKFKIGRGETCHLRPNSEQVSREHAEFTIIDGVVSVGDLGSRNGTLVNGKALTTGICALKDRDLVQVGPLTFAVSIQDAPAAAAKPAAPAPPAAKAAPTPPSAAKPAAAPSPAAAKPALPPTVKAPTKSAAQARSAPEDVLNEDIDSWLVGEATGSSSEVPTTVYGGDTITITAFKDAEDTPPPPAPPAAAAAPKQPVAASDDEYERQEEEEEEEDEEEEELDDSIDDEDEDEEEEDSDEEDDEDEDEDEDDEEEKPADEFIDESNPFYVAKKAQQQTTKPGAAGAGGANQQFKDTSDAASEILRKLMERRKASK